MSVCNFCFNAHVYASMPKTVEEECFGTDLTDSNDWSSSTVGCHADNYQIYINAGNGKPVNIETCEWAPDGRWRTVAIYYPKYCPECGRQLLEYEITERGGAYTKVKEKES